LAGDGEIAAPAQGGGRSERNLFLHAAHAGRSLAGDHVVPADMAAAGKDDGEPGEIALPDPKRIGSAL
jgi:hypothetical protein